MNEQQFHFEGPIGLRLHGRSWTVSGAKTCLIGVHGYSEHSACYRHLAEYFNELDCDVYWMDLPGHGLSEGRRSDISDFNHYVESFDRFFSLVEKTSAISPRLFFAHSLGALVGIRFLQTRSSRSLQRVALSSPLLGLSSSAFHGLGCILQNPVGLSLLQLITSILPNRTLPNERDLGGSVLTHDVEMQKRRAADPLIKSAVTIHWTREFLKARRRAFNEIDKLQLPIGIFQAGDERVVSREAAQKFYESLRSQEKKLVVYDGFFHEIVNEIGRERVLSDLGDWFQVSVPAERAEGSN